MRWLLSAALLASALLIGAGLADRATEPPSSTSPQQQRLIATEVTPGKVLARKVGSSEPVRPIWARLQGISAPVVPLALTSATLVPPSDPRVLGWWGRLAGARHGVTLLVGHTVHTGGGELDHLDSVPVGSQANVSGVRYRVTSIKVLAKPVLARRAPMLFSQTGPPRLVVVTCTDYNWATGTYASNTVLTALPEHPARNR